MSLRQEPQENFDPFARAIPGQSFTDIQGSRPYEKPPMSSKPEDVLESLEQSLKEEDTAKGIADLLDVGISCEAISDTLVKKCFAEGMCSPDVAELVKPGIFVIIAQIGEDEGISDIVLFNKREDNKRISTERKLDLMEKLSPAKFRNITEDPDLKTGFEDEDEEDIGMLEDESMEEEEVPSFMDMASSSEDTEDTILQEDEEMEIA